MASTRDFGHSSTNGIDAAIVGLFAIVNVLLNRRERRAGRHAGIRTLARLGNSAASRARPLSLGPAPPTRARATAPRTAAGTSPGPPLARHPTRRTGARTRIRAPEPHY